MCECKKQCCQRVNNGGCNCNKIFKMVLSSLRHMGPSGGTFCEIKSYIKCTYCPGISDKELTQCIKLSLCKAIKLTFLRKNPCDRRYYIATTSCSSNEKRSSCCCHCCVAGCCPQKEPCSTPVCCPPQEHCSTSDCCPPQKRCSTSDCCPPLSSEYCSQEDHGGCPPPTNKASSHPSQSKTSVCPGCPNCTPSDDSCCACTTLRRTSNHCSLCSTGSRCSPSNACTCKCRDCHCVCASCSCKCECRGTCSGECCTCTCKCKKLRVSKKKHELKKSYKGR